MPQDVTRRRFLRSCGGVAAVATGAVVVLPAAGEAAGLSRVDSVPGNVTRTWLAPQYWANRLADWRLSAGRFECLTSGRGGGTVAVLTRSIAPGALSGSLLVRTGTLSAGAGCSGFLLGAGAGRLDWRAAALVMRASGRGGGLLAVYDSDGHVRFRDHTDEQAQFAYAALPSTARSGPAPARRAAEDVVLRLDITHQGAGLSTLTLSARDRSSGALLSTATRRDVADAEIVGGLSLVSFAHSGGNTARFWLRDLQTTGSKIAVHDRAMGPVAGTLYSVSGSVLKLTAQFMPIGAAEPQQASLQTRLPGATAWTTRQTVAIGRGYAAVFRVTGWDASRTWEYRVAYAVGTAHEAHYTGRVARDPRTQGTVSIGMINCTIHSFRNLDIGSSGAPRLPGEAFRGLYTTENLYFPYAETVRGMAHARPDLLVAFGDQYYENKPTRKDLASPLLDVLGRYLLWLWSFGSLTRNVPTICLVDDHDVYHANLWGWSGQAAADSDPRYGGYVMPASWVQDVQRMQCAHNPDPYDPTPVQQGISVYYTAFSYGGVSFAVLEDRKFKNTNQFGRDRAGNPLPEPRDLLGARQEAFLSTWTAMHPGQPKVCLTQTLFASLQTRPDGTAFADADSNGVPLHGRRTALRLLKQARAVILSGDQHLGSLVRHGLDTHTDGPVQFTAPATGSAWQRWFQPSRALPNASGPYTGDASDAYGNRLRVLAVANPRITFAQVRTVQDNNNVGDRDLKREGYGIVEVDKVGRQHRLHCWPWAEDPARLGAAEYAGWPYTLSFSSL